MKLISIFTFALLASCGPSKKTLEVWIENSSDLHDSIEVLTYLDDSLMDKRIVRRDSIADAYSPFLIDYNMSGNKKEHVLRFAIPDLQKQTSCLISTDSVAKGVWIHVNHVEQVWRKGRQIENEVLERDSVYDNSFYCEIIPIHKRK